MKRFGVAPSERNKVNVYTAFNISSGVYVYALLENFIYCFFFSRAKEVLLE